MPLRFVCKRCGACCRNIKELVLTDSGVAKIKKFIKKDDFYFRRNGIAYVRLKETKGCPFFENNACKIYSARPVACRSFPLQLDLKRNVWVLNRDACPGWNIQEYLQEQQYPLRNKYSYKISVGTKTIYNQ